MERDKLKPYLAAVLYTAANPKRSQTEILAEVVKEIEGQHLKSSPKVGRTILSSMALAKTDGFDFQAIIVEVKTTPAWDDKATYANLSHELIIVGVRGSHLAICSSDAAIRNQLAKKLKSARPLEPKSFSRFVGPEAVTIWLNGAHTPTVVRPTSKVLSGQALEYALDPIGDQTFGYSAIRSRPKIDGLGPAVVGTAPGSGRVWIGRPPDWQAFSKGLAAIMDHALSKKQGSKLYDFLAQPVPDGSVLKDAYGIAIVPPELLSDDDIPEADRLEARTWAYDAAFEIVATNGPSLELKPFLGQKNLGRLRLQVEVKDGLVSLDCDWIDQPPGLDDERSRCEAILKDPAKVKIYYADGYTIMHGLAYSSGYTDQPFDWGFVDTQGFRIDLEKPVLNQGETLAGKVGTGPDNSLFGLVVKRLYSKGWLACDDGSMELADFVHLDPVTETITLIHIKKSGSDKQDRQVSVADYEVVVSQAVKNIRHIDRSNLVAVLEKGKGKKIGAAVWKDRQKRTRADFIAAVKALPPTAEKAVVILQPRVTDREVEYCRRPKAARDRQMRMKQLNALMLSARLSVMSCGARFAAYGQKV